MRRFFAGRSGDGSFNIRQSLPGYDAGSAGFEGIAFDAQAYPGRVLSAGENFNGVTWTAAGGPGQSAFPHNAGKRPDILLAYAMPVSAGNTPTFWNGYATSPGGAGYVDFPLGSNLMNSHYCSPFYINQVYTSNTGGPGGQAFCGWYYQYDGTNILTFNFTKTALRIRWAAMEL